MTIHKKLLKANITLSCLLLLAGCSNQDHKIFQTSVQKGMDAVSHDYEHKVKHQMVLAAKAKKLALAKKAHLKKAKAAKKKHHKQAAAIGLTSAAIASSDNFNATDTTLLQETEANYTDLFTQAQELSKNADYIQSNELLDQLLSEDLSRFISLETDIKELKEANLQALKNGEDTEPQIDEQLLPEQSSESEDETPLAWDIGIKEAFEQQLLENGLVNEGSPLLYKEIENGSTGTLDVFTLTENDEELYVATVNVTTGAYFIK